MHTFISITLNVNRGTALTQGNIYGGTLKKRETYGKDTDIFFIPICGLVMNIDFRLKLGSTDVV